ncbi:Cytochrome c551 peroxidase [Pseudomonas aeruginosa]|nr:Cytochrome c551 peroxidase [Pseudomonas aeruginosa]CAI9911937.1 Cytochrome c551 peroxidase [Pseudomonas aeruginosa]
MQSSQLLPLGSLLLSFATPLAQADALHDQASALFKPIPEQVTELRGQPISEQQRELGKKLFFDPRLSRSHVLSCNTCHNVGTGGADNVPTSVGHGWQKGPRNSPTVFNAVFNAAQFWDGRAKDLGEQAKGPIQNSVEMHSTPQLVEQTLGSIPEYVDAFRKAFPKAGKPVSFDNMALAIEAYEATLVTPDSPFDLYLKGDDKALDAQQKKGLKAFMDSGCSACHNGINLGGQAYFPFGLVKKPDASVLPSGDKGRFAVTKTQSDEYVFRAVLPQRPGLGTQGRGGDHGQRPARQAVGAGRRGEHRRLPAQPERQAAARRISAAAGQHGDHAASRGITATRKNGAPLEPRFSSMGRPQTTPCASIASATLTKPAMFAPFT